MADAIGPGGQELTYEQIIERYGLNPDTRTQDQHVNFNNRFNSFGYEERNLTRWLTEYVNTHNIHIHYDGIPYITLSNLKESRKYDLMKFDFEIEYRIYPEGVNLEYDFIWNILMEHFDSLFRAAICNAQCQDCRERCRSSPLR